MLNQRSCLKLLIAGDLFLSMASQHFGEPETSIDCCLELWDPERKHRRDVTKSMWEDWHLGEFGVDDYGICYLDAEQIAMLVKIVQMQGPRKFLYNSPVNSLLATT